MEDPCFGGLRFGGSEVNRSGFRIKGGPVLSVQVFLNDSVPSRRDPGSGFALGQVSGSDLVQRTDVRVSASRVIDYSRVAEGTPLGGIYIKYVSASQASYEMLGFSVQGHN